MKKISTALFALLITGTLFAKTPFNSDSDGYDWKSASAVYKMEYCQLMANVSQKLAPGITAEIIYDSLSQFYTSDDDQVLKQKIVQTVALTVSVYSKTKDQ